MGEMRNTYKAFIGKYERKECWGNLGIDGRILLKSILNNVHCSVAMSCEHGNETSYSIRDGELLD
jgi:hypothetical protein